MGLVAVVLLMALVLAGGALASVLTIAMIHQSIERKGKLGVNIQATTCPECEEPLPAIRKPQNTRQVLWGGWTCAKCGTELDKWGQPV